MKEVKGVRVYRLRDSVAVAFKFEVDGDLTPSVYLDPDVAQNLAVALADFADDIGDVRFSKSTKKTLVVKVTPDGVTLGTET